MGSLSNAEMSVLADQTEKTITGLIKTKAAALQYNDPKTAIDILNKAVKIMHNRDLEMLLGEILNIQSVKVLNELMENLNAGRGKGKENIVPVLEKEVKNLERAVELGCRNASQNLEVAKEMLEQARHGMLGVNPEISNAISQAMTEANRNNYDKAVAILEAALKKAKPGDQEALKTVLAQMLNQRGVQKANAVNETINAQSNAIGRKFRRLMNSYLKPVLWIIFLFRFLFTGLGHLGNIFWVEVFHYYFIQAALNILGIEHVPNFWSNASPAPSTTWGIVLTVLGMITLFIIYITTVARRWKKPICDVKFCFAPVKYVHSIPGQGEVHVCSKHSKKIQRIAKQGFKLNSKDMSMLRDAQNDLTTAQRYAPNNQQIRENLSAINEMASNVT